MGISLLGRSLLTLFDYSAAEIQHLLQLSRTVKGQCRENQLYQRFRGKTIALLFEKRSTRTRCAFETAFGEEGGYPVFLSTQDIHLGVKEDLKDTARVLGRMFDAIQFRGFKQETAETLAKYSGVPVYNGLTDSYHPTQALADIMTLEENFGETEGRTICYIGDCRNNVAVSLMIASVKLGIHITLCAPGELKPDEAFTAKCRNIAEETGSRIKITDKPETALPGADAVYTDVWASMGEEDKLKERKELLAPYQVDEEKMSMTGNMNTIFLHCLPAVKGNEVVESVIEGPASRVWDQAENRKHTIKAVMLATLIK
ncbi:MAG: ornithine carbamoyltransferase [Spirochaetia bacterium]